MNDLLIERVPTVRISPDNESVLGNLGLLAEFAGNWQGEGFNLIARPNFEGNANLYLQLSQTRETLKVDPIGSSIPNRGFGQADIELFGLTYLQKISDADSGGALHIEPGIWVTQPPTTYPVNSPTPAAAQIVARMGSIPHGNALLAQGVAQVFLGSSDPNFSGCPIRLFSIPIFQQHPVSRHPNSHLECRRIERERDRGGEWCTSFHGVRPHHSSKRHKSENSLRDKPAEPGLAHIHPRSSHAGCH